MYQSEYWSINKKKMAKVEVEVRELLKQILQLRDQLLNEKFKNDTGELAREIEILEDMIIGITYLIREL